MKYILSFILCLISFQLIAQSKDEKAVMVVVEKLRVAMIDPDRQALENLVSDSLSYGHSSGHIEGKKEFIENFVQVQD